MHILRRKDMHFIGIYLLLYTEIVLVIWGRKMKWIYEQASVKLTSRKENGLIYPVLGKSLSSKNTLRIHLPSVAGAVFKY